MQNQKTIEIQRLRGVALNENESPEERIKAAARLLSKFGPTNRNVPIIHKVIKLFDDNADYGLKERALKLKEKLVKARGLKEVAQVEVPEEPECEATVPATDATVPSEVAVVSGDLSDEWQWRLSGAEWNRFVEVHRAVSPKHWELWPFNSKTDAALLDEIFDKRPLTVESATRLQQMMQRETMQHFPVFTVVSKWLLRQNSLSKEEKKPDGFQRGLIDPEAAIARVLCAGYKKIPDGAKDTNLLQVALGEVPLDEKSVAQLWLTFGYWFKEVLGGGPGRDGSVIMPAQSRWIVACICGYANPRHIGIPTPSIFSFADDLAFRT